MTRRLHPEEKIRQSDAPVDLASQRTSTKRTSAGAYRRLSIGRLQEQRPGLNCDFASISGTRRLGEHTCDAVMTRRRRSLAGVECCWMRNSEQDIGQREVSDRWGSPSGFPGVSTRCHRREERSRKLRRSNRNIFEANETAREGTCGKLGDFFFHRNSERRCWWMFQFAAVSSGVSNASPASEVCNSQYYVGARLGISQGITDDRSLSLAPSISQWL